LVYSLLVLLFLFIQFSGHKERSKAKAKLPSLFYCSSKIPVVPGCLDEFQHMHPVSPTFFTQDRFLFLFRFMQEGGKRVRSAVARIRKLQAF
jgi:hypothetical protein